MLSGGIGVLWALASSEWVDRITGRGISWAIARWTSLDTRDYARILHLREDYGVTDLRVQDGDWIAGRTLAQSGLVKEGTLVLGIECPGNHFIGAPPPDAEVRADVFHAGAVAEQERVAVEERTRAGR